MAKGTKKTKGNGSEAPRDGVVHEDGTPVYLEKLTADEQAAAGLQLAEAQLELEELKADWKERSAEHREEKKQLEARITALGEQVRSGVRKQPAQQTFKGTDAPAGKAP